MRTLRRIGMLALAACASAVLAPGIAAADTFLVDTVADAQFDGECVSTCTLRDAVGLAGPADVVSVPAGRYELTEEAPLTLAGDTIAGAGARSTVVDGLDSTRVLLVSGGSNRVSGLTIAQGNTFGGNDANSGAGIYVQSPAASLTLVDSTVTGGEAATGGGITSVGTLTVVGSTIAGNLATQPTSGALGGGIAVFGGTTTLRNSTVSDNQAQNQESPAVGGGIVVQGGSLVTESATIAGNRAPFGSALAVQGTGSPVAMTHTILAGLSGGIPCAGAVIQGTHNLADHSSCGVPVADPRLGPLAANGGPTDTHALLAGSPAINAGGTCPPTDQRGVARVGPCDVGAYESAIPGSPPPPPPPPPAGQQPLPPPEAGKTVNALPKRGTVRIKLPGSETFVVLSEGQQIPVGTIVDVRKGRVTIVAAADRNGKTATADFYGGIFRLGQTKGSKPVTTLKLVQKLSCGKPGRRAAAAAAKKKRKKRRLWGDGKGRFRTEGKHSSATVRGTKWLVEDRCTSTLTRVVRGRVAVRDFARRKTVLVRAGKKYVARARG